MRGTLPTRTRLGSNQFVQFPRHRALRLQADSGTLWVTQDGEPDDIQIDAGGGRVFDGHAVLTVGTLGGDAWFSATPVSPPPRPFTGLFTRLLAWHA